MVLPPDIRNWGFCLIDVDAMDMNDFVRVNRLSYKKYIDEYSDFFGEWNDEVAINAFRCKMRLSFFGKLILNDEAVGFLNYDVKENAIDDISITIIETAQNKGIGSFFLSYLIKSSNEMGKPIDLF